MLVLLGGVFVALGGVLIGGSAWPMKIMHKYRFENWWFVSMFIGLIVLPWTMTFVCCPHALSAYHDLDPQLILKANIFSFGWGIANVLCGLCYVRIGFALTGGILTGLGVSLGVTVPLIFKGSGLFAQSPSLWSPAGHVILAGVALILAGVVMVVIAGFGRQKGISAPSAAQGGSFSSGLTMVILAGLLSVGLSFAFVFCQGPIMRTMKEHGASDLGANFGVWSVSLLGGALVNIFWPIYLMTKTRTWSLLVSSSRDAMLSALIGITMVASIAFMGKGMLLLGVLGASVGFGIQQSMQMLANQAVGFVSGEWSNVDQRPRRQMYLAIVLLLAATVILAYGNTLAKI